VAALIEEYEFLRAQQTPDYFAELRKQWDTKN
jgi:hypothetical protein